MTRSSTAPMYVRRRSRFGSILFSYASGCCSRGSVGLAAVAREGDLLLRELADPADHHHIERFRQLQLLRAGQDIVRGIDETAPSSQRSGRHTTGARSNQHVVILRTAVDTVTPDKSSDPDGWSGRAVAMGSGQW